MKTMMESRVVSSCWRAGVGRLRRYSREPGQKGRKLKFLLWTLLTLTACSSVALPQKVKVGYDKSVDFSKYATYTWAPPGMPPSRPLLYRHVVGTIDEHLKSKGLKKTEQGGDLIVAAVGGIDFGVNTPAGTPILPTYSGLPPSIDSGMWVGASGPSGGMAPLVSKGTLLLELVDARANKVIWSGSVAEKLDPDKQEESLRRVSKAIEKLLTNLPPEKKK